MKKFFVAAVLIAIAATLVNDGGRYLRAIGSLDSGTRDVVSTAAAAARRDRSKNQPGGKAAVLAATERGITLYGYQVENNEVQVWTLDEVEGTWVAGPFLAWQAGKPLDTPFQITEQDTAFIR